MSSPPSSSSDPHYHPAEADYAILLTYLPTGIRVRATPVSVASGGGSGIPRRLPVHQPSLALNPQRAKQPAIPVKEADKVLELDIQHAELSALGTPQEGKDAAFLELLMSQLCVYVNSNQVAQLIFTPSTTNGAPPQPATNGSHPTVSHTYHSVTSVSTTSSQYFSNASSGDEQDYSADEFDDPNFVEAMIPPAVAAAAKSETPLKTRSPLTKLRQSAQQGIPSVPLRGFSNSDSPKASAATPQRNALPPLQSIPHVSTFNQAPLSSTSSSSQSQPPTRIVVSPPPSTIPAASTSSLSAAGSNITPRGPSPTSPVSSVHSTPSSPRPTSASPRPHGPSELGEAHSIYDLRSSSGGATASSEMRALRKENAELKAQLLSAAEREEEHLKEIASLKRKLDSTKEKVVEYEEQLFLLQPNIKQLHEHGISVGALKTPVHSRPSTPDGSDRTALISSLRSQLATSAAMSAASQAALLSLQAALRHTHSTLQAQFHANGQTLRLSVEVAKAENELVKTLSSGDKQPLSSWAPFSPNSAKAQQDALDQSFAVERELESTDIEHEEATNAELHSHSKVSLDKLLSVSHALESRTNKMLNVMQERGRLLHATLSAIQQTGVQLRGEVETIRRESAMDRFESNLTLAQAKQSKEDAIRNAPEDVRRSRTIVEEQGRALGLKGQQLEFLRKSLDERDQQVSELTASLIALQSSQAKQDMLHTRSNATRGQRDREMEGTMEALQAEIVTLNQKLAFATKERSNSTSLHQRKSEVAQDMNHRYQREIHSRDEQIASLRRQLEMLNTRAKGVSDAAAAAVKQSQSMAHPEDLQAALVEIDFLRGELSSLRTLHSDNASNILSIHNEVNTKNMQLIALQSENVQLAEENQRMESIIAQAKDQASKLSTKLSNFETNIIPALGAENAKMKTEIENLTQKIARLTVTQANTSRELQTAQEELEQALKQRESSQNSIATLEGLVAELRRDQTTAQSRLMELELENQTLSNRLSNRAMKEQSDQLLLENRTHEWNSSQHQLELLKNENQILSNHVDSTKANLGLLQTQHEELQKLYRNLLETREKRNAAASIVQLPSNSSTNPSDLAAIIKENYALKLSLHQAAAASASAASKNEANEALFARKLAQDQEAALQQVELLRSQNEMHARALQLKDQVIEEEIERTKAVQSQLNALEAVRSQLQSQIAKYQSQNDEAMNTISGLHHQLRTAQANLTHKEQAAGTVENEIALLMEEKNRALNQLSETKKELHVKGLQLQDSLGVITNLESELSSLKLNVVIPYQKNHLDIGCESLRMQLELEVKNMEANLNQVQKQLKSKDLQVNELQGELDRTKGVLSSGNKEWTSIVPQLKRDKKFLEETLDKLGEDLKEFATELSKTRREKRAISSKKHHDAHQQHADASSPFRASHAHHADDAAAEDAHDFDLEAHLEQLPHAAGGSSTSGYHKYHSVFAILLHDLSPCLTHYLELLHSHTELEGKLSAFTRHSRDEVAQLDGERMELLRKLQNAEAEIDHLNHEAHRSLNGKNEMSNELNDIRNHHRTASEKVQSLSGQLDTLKSDKKELQQSVDSLLTLQKNWEVERVLLIETNEALSQQKEKLQRTADTSQKDLDSLQKELDAAIQKHDALKREHHKLVQKDKEYRDKDLTLHSQGENIAGLQSTLSLRDGEIRDMHDEYQLKKNEIRALQEENFDLKKLKENQTRLVEKLKNKEEELLRRNQQLQEEVDELIRDAREPFEKLRAAHARAEEDLLGWETKFSELAAKLGVVCQEKEDVVREKYKQLQTHKDYAQKMKQEWDKEREEILAESEDKDRAARAQIKSLSENLKAAEDRQLELERSAHQSQNAASKQLSSLKSELARFNEKFNQLEVDHASLQQAKDLAEASISQLQKQVNKAEHDLEHVTAQLESATDRSKKLSKENERLAREVLTASRDAARDAESALARAEKESEKRAAQLEVLERDLAKVERALENVQLEKKELDLREKSTQKSLEVTQRDLQLKTDELQRYEKTKGDETKQAQEKLFVYEAQLRKHQESYFVLESKFKEMESEKLHTGRSLHDAERRLHEFEVERTNQARVLNEAERKNREFELELQMAQRNAHEMERKVYEANMAHENLNREKIPRLEQSITQLTQTIYERTSEKEGLKKKLSEVEYALGEGKSKLEYELSAAKKEMNSLTMRVQSEADTVSQLRAAIHNLEREQSHKSNQWVSEASAKDAELLQIQQLLSKALSDKEVWTDKYSKVEKKLKELSIEHDAVFKANQKSSATISQLESAVERLAERDAECKAIHVHQWEPLLERTTRDLKEHTELVNLLRDELGVEKASSKQIQDEAKRLMEDTFSKKDRAFHEEVSNLKRAHTSEVDRLLQGHSGEVDRLTQAQNAEVDRLTQAYEQLRQEYAAMNADHNATVNAMNTEHNAIINSHMDKIHMLQATLDGRSHDLERIRTMLGVEWDELVTMSENSVLRERAKLLFNVEAQLSISQLQDLVKQQNLHLEDSKKENAELNRLVSGLKSELQVIKNQKSTEHATMDKLLSANKRLQQFIDSLPTSSKANFVPPSTFVSRSVSPAYLSPVKEHPAISTVPSSTIPPPSFTYTTVGFQSALSTPAHSNTSLLYPPSTSSIHTTTNNVKPIPIPLPLAAVTNASIATTSNPPPSSSPPVPSSASSPPYSSTYSLTSTPAPAETPASSVATPSAAAMEALRTYVQLATQAHIEQQSTPPHKKY